MRCKHCKNKFIPKQFLQKFCMEKDECISEFLKGMREKQKKEIKAKEIKEIKVLKEKLKTHSEWLRDLEVVFNSYIRERDKNQKCISCNNFLIGKYDAGHFFSKGAYINLRFDEDNVFWSMCCMQPT